MVLGKAFPVLLTLIFDCITVDLCKLKIVEIRLKSYTYKLSKM
jgi:hypothetical protein